MVCNIWVEQKDRNRFEKIIIERIRETGERQTQASVFSHIIDFYNSKRGLNDTGS